MSAVRKVKLYETRFEHRFGAEVGEFAEEKGAELTVLFAGRMRKIQVSRARGLQARKELRAIEEKVPVSREIKAA